MPVKMIPKSFVLLLMLAIYNFFFWKEKLGLNFIIFAALLAIMITLLNPGSIRSGKVILFLAAVLYSGIMVLVNNSVFSKIAVFTALMLLTGYAHQQQLRSLFASFCTCIASYFMIPAIIFEGITEGKSKSRVIRLILRSLKLLIIPAFTVMIFYILYVLASVKFDFYAGLLFGNISAFLSEVFKDYTFARFMFIFLGFVLLAGVLYNSRIVFIKNIDIIFRDKLSRDKAKKLEWLYSEKRYIPLNRKLSIFPPRINSLLTEQKIGAILLLLVNLLTLSFNVIDIKFTWFGFDPAEITGFKTYVHEGTYILIFSIMLSMLIMLYYFRGNINFCPANRVIKILAFVWIAQNAIMTFSVGLRNYYYIYYTHTITYKRIGVYIYLILTLTGLITMLLMIIQKRTTYNIIKINSWALITVLMLMCSFNWDKTIAEYNLSSSKPYETDIAYLLELSDDVLPSLYERKELMNRNFIIPRSSRGKQVFARDYFNMRVDFFINEQSNYSWLSWNLPDINVKEFFKNINYKNEN